MTNTPPINIDQVLPNLEGLAIWLKRSYNERQRGEEDTKQTQQKPELCLCKGNICHTW